MKTIAEVMTRDVTAIEPQGDLQHAAQLMRDIGVGALPVCEGKRLVGMITDRDITIRSTAAGLLPQGDLATRQEAPIESTLEDISRPAPPARESTGKQPGTHQ